MNQKAHVYALLNKHRKHLACGGDITLAELDALRKAIDAAMGTPALAAKPKPSEAPKVTKTPKAPKKTLFKKVTKDGE